MPHSHPMTTVSSQQIANYRSLLSEHPDALAALDAIEDCEGDLEDATISLGIQVGQQPDRNDWLDGLAKRCRVALCQEDIKENLLKGNMAAAWQYLIETKVCHELLAAPLLIYVTKMGVKDFCAPLDLKL